MDALTKLVAFFAAYLLVGALALALLDNNGKWLRWFESAPFAIIMPLALLLWPITAAAMLITWKKWRT